jgi:hypothetical protein
MTLFRSAGQTKFKIELQIYQCDTLVVPHNWICDLGIHRSYYFNGNDLYSTMKPLLIASDISEIHSMHKRNVYFSLIHHHRHHQYSSISMKTFEISWLCSAYGTQAADMIHSFSSAPYSFPWTLLMTYSEAKLILHYWKVYRGIRYGDILNYVTNRKMREMHPWGGVTSAHFVWSFYPPVV